MQNNTDRISSPKNFKFLRRKLYLSEERDQHLAKIQLKQLHLKELNDKGFKQGQKSYINKKQLRCLQTLDIDFLNPSHAINMLKNCRMLKKAHVMLPVNNFIPWITRLSKDLKHLDLLRYIIYDEGDVFNTRGHNRALIRFRKLKTFSQLNDHSIYLQKNIQNVIKENKFLTTYMPMMKDLKKLDIKFTLEELLGLQKLMEQDQICPYVTDLSIEMGPAIFDSFNAVRRLLSEEEIYQDYEESKEGQEDQHELVEDEDDRGKEDDRRDEQQIQVIKNEMPPFFKFHLFRNLRKLSLTFCQGYHYALDSFVVEGFKSLQNLEHLNLNFGSRPIGTKYFFDGLAHLPLLTSFSLKIKLIRDNEFSLLSQFLKKQTQLVSLSLNIPGIRTRKREYQAQNLWLEDTWKFLNNKSQLKYLSLKSGQWTIESLSKSLEKTDLLPQLQSLEIEVLDDDVTSKSSAEERVKGLCDFLARQSNLLRTLKINISFVMDAAIIDAIVKTLQVLKGLNTLRLVLNDETNYAYQKYKQYFKYAFSAELPKPTDESLPKYQDTFSHLEIALKQLSNLEQLNIQLNTLVESKVEMEIDSSVVFNALPTMKEMKDLSLILPYLRQAFEKNPHQASKLLELQKLKHVVIYPTEDESVPILEQTWQDINKNQVSRCDLMF